MLTQVLALACGLACGEPGTPDRSPSVTACPESAECRTTHSMNALTIARARSATRDGDWNEAADLWRDALLIDDRIGVHWVMLGDVLSNAQRYREAIAAYQRAIQRDARLTRTGTRRVARSFARMGNDRQAVRWLEQTLRLGVSPAELWDDEAFERYRHDPRLQVMMKRQADSRGHRRLPPSRRS